jgi:lipopolysaccharide/colanic/teichoic acid biosynthesis glycosyltransferase
MKHRTEQKTPLREQWREEIEDLKEFFKLVFDIALIAVGALIVGLGLLVALIYLLAWFSG